MKVPFYDFQKLHDQDFIESIKNLYNDIFTSQGFIEGKYNKSFEADFSHMQDSKHCVLVGNGTDALELSLLALGVGPGDRVAVPSFTFFASAEAVINVGATPVLIDVNENTGLICLDSLKRMTKDHPCKAVMPVHILGQNAPIEELEPFCEKENIAIVEDAAQAQGGTYQNGKPIGSSGHLVTFSFYPTKNLSAFGDAGAIMTSSAEINEKLRCLRNHGRSANGHVCVGRNSRCDELQAAVLWEKLKTVQMYNKKRKEIAKMYFEALKDLPIKLPLENMLETSSWHLYSIFLTDSIQRDGMREKLTEAGIGTGLFYSTDLGSIEPLKKYPGESKVAKSLSSRVLNLPIHPFVTSDDVNYIAENLRQALT